MGKFWKNQKGLTMMEVLVTVALLAIVVVPCLSSFVMAQRGNVLAREVYNEYTTAANIMEELKRYSSVDEVYSKLVKNSDLDVIPTPGVYVLCKIIDNKYVEVWICKDKNDSEPERLNEKIENDSDPEQSDEHEIILKGVIAP